MPRPPTLEEILNDPDDHGLLRVEAENRPVAPEDRQAAGFEEINVFVDVHGRPPSRNASDMTEKRLAQRLEAIIKDPGRVDHLRAYDRYGLLPGEDSPEPEPPSGGEAPDGSAGYGTEAGESTGNVPEEDDAPAESLDAILADDELLGGGDDSIFDLQHVEPSERATPDDVAQRTPCEDFAAFKGLFDRMHERIENGELEVVRFRGETQIREGEWFIVGGILCLVDAIYDEQERGKDGRLDHRTRVIFANRTETNLLRRSLARALYDDEHGRRVLPDPDTVAEQMAGISHRYQHRGVVYVLRSLRDDPQLRAFRHLHKIGFTEGDLDKRIAHAEQDPTFLEAPVEVAMRMDCYSFNPQRFETLLHGFLAKRRVKLRLHDARGRVYEPQEWFDVPLETAEAVCRRILDRSIVDYRLDPVSGELRRKS